MRRVQRAVSGERVDTRCGCGRSVARVTAGLGGGVITILGTGLSKFVYAAGGNEAATFNGIGSESFTTNA